MKKSNVYKALEAINNHCGVMACVNCEFHHFELDQCILMSYPSEWGMSYVPHNILEEEDERE